MTRSDFRRLTVCLVLALLVLALPLAQAAPRTDTVLLLHTNDIHDNMMPYSAHWGGLVYISGYIHAARDRRPDVLALDAGDICEKGDMLGVVTEGRLSSQAMAAVGYDAGTVGNHEKAYGVTQWKANADASGFPLVACNILYEDTGEPVLPPYREFDVDGVKVAVIGVANSIAGKLGDRTVVCLNPEAVAPRLAELSRELKTRNHLVVVVAHWGSADCRSMAAAAPAVDVFVSGHTHELLPEPVAASPGGAPIVQTGEYAQRIGELELTVDLDARKLAGYRGRLVRLDHATTPIDASLAAKLTRWTQEECPEALEVVGRAPLSMPRSTPSGRASGLTRWMAEAICDYAGADVGVFGNGMIRHPLHAGPVLGNDLYKISVNGRRRAICEATVSGSQLLAAAESLLARSDAASLHLAGLHLRTDRSRPAGQRVVSSDIDPTAQYRIAVPWAYCTKTDGTWSLGFDMRERTYTAYEAAVRHAKKQGAIIAPAD